MSGHGFKADQPLGYAKIERAAQQVRAIIAAGRTAVEAIPGIELLENLNQHWMNFAGRDVRWNYGVSEIPVEALTRYDADRDEIIIVVSEGTYADLRDEIPRSRFCLCHEIGHAILHFQQVMRLSRIPHHAAALMRGQWPQHPAYYDTEWQANAFASALLMPAAGLEQLRQQDRLVLWVVCDKYRVSAAAAHIRLDTFSKRRTELV